MPITRSPGARSPTSEPTSRTTPAPSLPIVAFARIEAEGDQDVAEVESGGAHRDPHLGRAQRLGGAGAGHEREALQGAALQARRGATAPAAGSASPRCPRSASPAAPAPPLAQGELRAPRRRSPARRQRCLGGLAAVAVDQGEAAGVLGLGRADQAPDRRGGGVGGLVPVGGHRASGDQRQARVGLGLVGEPPLDRLQGALGRPAGGLGDRGVAARSRSGTSSTSAGAASRSARGTSAHSRLEQPVLPLPRAPQLRGIERAQGQGADRGKRRALAVGEPRGQPSPLRARSPPAAPSLPPPAGTTPLQEKGSSIPSDALRRRARCRAGPRRAGPGGWRSVCASCACSSGSETSA